MQTSKTFSLDNFTLSSEKTYFCKHAFSIWSLIGIKVNYDLAENIFFLIKSIHFLSLSLKRYSISFFDGKILLFYQKVITKKQCLPLILNEN